MEITREKSKIKIIRKYSIDDGDNTEYSCKLTICDNPTCTCGDINFNFESKNIEPIRKYNFTIDVYEKKLYQKSIKENKDETVKFATNFLSNLTDKDLQELCKTHQMYKQTITENIDPKKSNIDFSPFNIESENEMIPHHMVLPFAENIYYEHKGNRYLAELYFCLRRKCNCTDTLLSFIPPVEDSSEAMDVTPAIRLNYVNESWKIEDYGAFTKDLIYVLMQKALKDNIHIKAQKAHTKLKELYEAYYERNKPQPIIYTPKNKIGRNDPCPCGSGKKYKKCCL